MPIHFTSTVDNVARALGETLDSALERAIKRELSKRADVIVAEAARQLVKDVRANLVRWNDHGLSSPEITLILDGVKDLAKSRVWSEGADDGMRLPEASDLAGGATDTQGRA